MKYNARHLYNWCRSPLPTFIVLAAFFGFAIVSLAPPFTGADEEAHFVRAYGISQGNLRLYDSKLVEMPESFRKTIGCMQTKTDAPGIMYRYDYSAYGEQKQATYKCAFSIPLQKDKTELVETTAQFYSPLSYVPQVLAISIGKIAGLPIVAISYLVRIATLLAYILLIALAIRLIPVRKWALAGTALLPIPLLSLTNPGGDYVLFGVTAIIAAIIIRSIYIPTPQLGRENKYLLSLLAAASVLLVTPKGIFPGICVLPLVLFYGGLKRYRIQKMAIIIIAIIVGFLWQHYGVNVNLLNAGMAPSSPSAFPEALIYTMFTRWVETDFLYTGDSVGNIPLPGNHLGMPALVITIMNMLVALYLFVAYPEKSRLRLSERQRKALVFLSVLCSLAIVIGSFAVLFVGQSSLQNPGEPIRGVQTRYFYPALFILSVIPFLRGISMLNERTMMKFTIAGTIICLSSAAIISAAI